MPKVKRSARKSISHQYHQECHTGNKKPNIFKLTEGFKSLYFKSCPYDEYKDNLVFAEACLSFLEAIESKKVKKLKFDPAFDDINTFIGSLVEIITGQGFFIGYNRYDTDFPQQFMYDIPYEPQWWVLPLIYLEKIKSKALRIGYAYMIANYDRGCERSITDYSYDESRNEETTPMDFKYEEALAYWRKDEFLKEYVKNFEAHKKRGKQLLNKYYKYREYPLEIFHKSRPRNEYEKELKKLITEGLNYDYTLTYQFADNGDYENGETSYTELHKVIAGTDDAVEKEWLDEIEEITQHHGLIVPAGYFSYDKEKGIIHQTPPEKVTQFINSLDLIERLAGHLSKLN